MLYYQINTAQEASSVLSNTLDALELGVKHRLTLAYVINESPLPLDRKELLKHLGAKTKAFKLALEKILKLFFVETEDGYVSEEIETNIKEAKARQERAKIANDVKYGKQKNTETILGAPNMAFEELLIDNSKKININNPCISTNVDTTSPSFSLDVLEDGSEEKMQSTEKQPRKKKHKLPDDFRITPEIRNWYETRLLSECTWKPEDLPNFFEAYVAYCKANDKTYIDHYAALRQAIIGDWGKVREQRIQEERNAKRDYQYLSTKEKFSRCSKNNEKKLREEIYEHDNAVDRASDGAIVRTTRSNLSSEVDGGFWG